MADDVFGHIAQVRVDLPWIIAVDASDEIRTLAEISLIFFAPFNPLVILVTRFHLGMSVSHSQPQAIASTTASFQSTYRNSFELSIAWHKSVIACNSGSGFEPAAVSIGSCWFRKFTTAESSGGVIGRP